jgi:hypothetical protein
MKRTDQIKKIHNKITGLQNISLEVISTLTKTMREQKKELKKHPDCLIILRWTVESLDGLGSIMDGIKKDLIDLLK